MHALGTVGEFSRLQRSAFLKERERDLRKRDRERLAEMRGKITQAREVLKAAKASIVQQCRDERKALRVRLREEEKERIAQVRAEERKKQFAELTSQAGICNLEKRKIASQGKERISSLESEHKEARKTDRILRNLRREPKKSRSEARRGVVTRKQESDEEVLNNIPPDLHPFFEKTKHLIKARHNITRTEQLLERAAEDPEGVMEARNELADKELQRMIREYNRAQKKVKSPRRYSKKALLSGKEEPLTDEEVPF